jgi:hypothetical protein
MSISMPASFAKCRADPQYGARAEAMASDAKLLLGDA